MDFLPVVFNMSFVSGIFVLGTPEIIYLYGSMFFWFSFVLVPATAVSSLILTPFFYRLGITSMFQYLDMRFNSRVRTLGTVFMLLQMMTYCGFVLYSPSISLSAVSGLSFEACLIGVGLVGTFYTTIGGFKAVWWTNFYQLVIISSGILAVVIKGTMDAGGISTVLRTADRGGRAVFDDFSFDPTKAYSAWSLCFGGMFIWFTVFGWNQGALQRSMSLGNLRRAQVSMVLNSVVICILTVLICYIGILCYVFYANCDPVKYGVIDKRDQLVPLLALDVLGSYKGLSGLLLSSIFSSSLSSLSPTLNSLATVVYEDFFKTTYCSHASDKHALLFMNVLVVMFGFASIGIGFIVMELSVLMAADIGTYTMFSGPLFGLFILGMFFPWANSKGAFVGSLLSLFITGWLAVGTAVKKVNNIPKLPLSVQSCNWTAMPGVSWNVSEPSIMTSEAEVYEGIDRFYTISFMYYVPIATIVVLVVGLPVSFLTGPTRASGVDPKLICPVFDWLTPCLPQCALTALHCGVRHSDTNDHASESDDPSRENQKKNELNSPCNVDSSEDIQMSTIEREKTLNAQTMDGRTNVAFDEESNSR